MSYPILYLSDETNFESNGLGVLSDCITCEVTEERNGSFELIMQYPITGIHYDEIVDRAIIKAKPNQINNEQLFRVYRKSKPMSGIVTIAAAHISYDLSGIPCTPFTASGVADAILKLKNQTATNNPFEFTTDKTSTVPFSVNVPKSVRACMGGSEGSILDVYGGEFLFDNYTISLYNERGMDRGVVIKYGKNLIDINQEENCSNVYTGIYPYYVNPDTGKIIEIPQKILNVDRAFNFTKIKVLDFSNEFEEQPSPEELELFSVKYLQNNDISTPDISLNVSFVQLEQSEEYKGLQLLESVYLCDTVTVEFPKLGVNTTAKATKIVYDVLLDRVKSVHLGTIRTTIIDTVVEQKQEVDKVQSPTYLQQTVNKATNWITSGGGYMVAIKDENGQWKELLSLDTADIESAKSVWRWNNNGFGHSSTGYVGQFTTAITQDGQIVADFITTGTLNANIIKSGIISSVDGESYFDLSSGLVHTNNAEFIGGTIGGWNISEDAIYKATASGKYTFFKPTNSPYGVVWASGAESLTSYDEAGFLLYADGKVRMGGNTDTGYVEAEDASLGFYSKGGSLKALLDASIDETPAIALDLYPDSGLNSFVVTSRKLNDAGAYDTSFLAKFENANGILKTNIPMIWNSTIGGYLIEAQNLYAGLIHYRQDSNWLASNSFGVGSVNGPSASMELQRHNGSNFEIVARFDVYPNTTGEADVNLRLSDGNSGFVPLEFAYNQIWYNGDITAQNHHVSSTEDIKSNIKVADSVLPLFKSENSAIYSYNLKKTKTVEPEINSDDGILDFDSSGSEVVEEVENTTSYGFVIGDGYAVPSEVLAPNGKAINLYSMAAMTWKAIQEICEKIDSLEAKTNG